MRKYPANYKVFPSISRDAPSPSHSPPGKHCCVVCHVVVRGEHLHLVLARVDHKDHVFNGDAGLRNIGRKDDLEYLSSTCLSKICLDNNSACTTFVTPSGTLPKTALWSSLGNWEWRGNILWLPDPYLGCCWRKDSAGRVTAATQNIRKKMR